MNELERRGHTHVQRRSLQDERQPLGFLPTLWFWNDWEQQRLMMPITLLVSVPLGPLLFFAVEALGASIWLAGILCLVHPFLLMGVMERHIRVSLERRKVEVDVPRSVVSRDPGSLRVAALLGTLVSGAALAAVGSASIGVLLGLSLLTAACLAWLLAPAIRTRIRRLRERTAKALPSGDRARSSDHSE